MDKGLARAVLKLDKLDRRSRFRPDVLCFDKQLAFISDPSRWKTAACSRRAGKTYACAVYLLWSALSSDRTNAAYITLSRTNAKRIVWKQLLELNRVYHLGAQVNETELALDFPNGSSIYLTGAKDKVEIEKFRGLSLKLVIIDETQSFRPYIKDLVDDILVPCLWDVQGTLALIGTPGPMRRGTFYEACHSREWSAHHWTIKDNPWIFKLSGKLPEQILAEERKRRGIKESDPTYQRESLGKWIEDSESLVFKYTEAANSYADLPAKGEWSYVIGVDIGHDDADAIAVLGWQDQSQTLYLVDEFVRAKETITALGKRVIAMAAKYPPNQIVIDTGGLGKKIAEELRDRWGVHLAAAEKSRKLEHIELLNDALRTGALRVKPDSVFAQDALLVSWEQTAKGRKVSESFHSDITDAVLYAFRACKHYLSEVVPGGEREESEMERWETREMAKMEARKRMEWWETPELFTN